MLGNTNVSKNVRSILIENQGIKIDEKYVLKLSKEEIKNVYKEVKNSCKVIHFSPEEDIDFVLKKIDMLSPEAYPQLFIFIIDLKDYEFPTPLVYDRIRYAKMETECDVTRLQHRLNQKFGSDRSIILQVNTKCVNVSKILIYYKEKTDVSDKFIECQQDIMEEVETFSSFLNSFLDYKFNKCEDEILVDLTIYQNRSLILRFLRTLNLSDGFYENVILEMASNGTKADFLAVLDSSFRNDGRILNWRSQKYISDVFKDCNDPELNTSVLLKAVQNSNKEIINYLITYGTHLIQQLPFDHQVRVSTAALETNEFDVLCDLLEIADFPFPINFKSYFVNHARMCKIIAERIEFKAAIKEENLDKIDEFINKNQNLKFIYNPSNNSALTEAANLNKFVVICYLKLFGFQGDMCDKIIEKLPEEVQKKAANLAEKQRRKYANKSLYAVNESIIKLSTRFFIQNRRINKEVEAEYRQKIIKWFIDIYKVAPEMLDVAASCDSLKIIFDFESYSVAETSWSGSNSPLCKMIYIGAKLTDKDSNLRKQRKQKIKGVLAHELCHYVMRLVYENQENPYYKDREHMKELFVKIVKIIDKWSKRGSAGPDDECNGIISSVFKLYPRKEFHSELIVRVVQILAEYDDNEAQLGHLQQKYEILFDFWLGQVIPELHKYLQRNQEVIRLNGTFELLPSIKNLKYELRNVNEVVKLSGNKLVVVQTNVLKLLFINIHKYLQQKSGNLFDSQNIFIKPKKLKYQQLLDDFKQICSDNQELSIFVDCSKDIPDNLGNIFINKELNFIFMVSNEVQCDKLNKIINEQKMENVQKLKINYKWSDLTEESQKLMLNTKINFQNNSQITLNDLIQTNQKASEATKTDKEAINDLIDDQMLNLILENHQVNINSRKKEEDTEKYFQLLFKTRKFVKKTRVADIKKKENSSGFFKQLKRFFLGKNEPEASSLNEVKIKEQKIPEFELLSEVKSKQYVLISDQAGNGKSWAMKNFEKILREQNPTSWVTYVDLKQFIDEFKAQEGEPEFSSFIVENILKLKQKFEAKIFQKLYKNGKFFILFDGFDEIAPNYAEFVSKLAQNFQSNGGNQLWIATRDYFEVDLQEKLKLDVAYRLDEMTLKEGIDLIARSWVLMDLEMDNNEPKSKEDFDKCIKKSPKYESYQQKARQIIEKAFISRNNSVGLPQLFKMIADGFKDANDIDDLQGSKIYVKFIKLIYKRWSEQKGEIRNEASTDSQEYALNFNKFHQFHAILSLFPKLAKIFFPGYDGSEWPQEEIIACGILSLKNGKIYFIHETFRKYFVADAIVKVLNKKKVKEEVSKILDEIMTVDKFKIIRIFIFHSLNQKSMLEKVKPQMKKFIYCGENFGLFFTENLENLADFAIKVLKNGKYEKVKAVLDKNAKSFASNTKSTKLFLKFQEFFINFLEVDDLKNLIIEGTIFQRIIESSLEIELFEEFVIKTEKQTDRKFVRQAMILESDENIFHLLSQSANLNAHKVQKFLKIMDRFLTVTEILELVSKYNTYIEHVLKNRTESKSKESFEIMTKEFENYSSFQIFLKSIGEQRDYSEKIFLHSGFIQATWYDDFEVHKTIWKVLLKTFEDREELKNFILQKDEYGNNFIFNLVNRQENESTVEWTFKILKENFSEEHFEEILRSKGLRNMNLLQSAAFWSKNVIVHKFLWKIFREFFVSDSNFIDISTEVNDLNQNIFHIASLKSTSEVFEFMIQEFENFASRDKINIMLSNIDYKNQNLLQSAAWWNKSLKFHECLWKTLQKYIQPSEIFNFIKQTDIYGNNILLSAVKNNSQEIVELTWNKIQSFLNHDEQIEYLVSNEDCEHNLQTAAYTNQIDPNVRNWIGNLLHEYSIKYEEKKASTSAMEPKSIDNTTEDKSKEDKKPLKVIWRNNTNQNDYFIEMNDEQSAEFCKQFITQEIKGKIIEYLLFKSKKVHVQDLISDTGCNLLIFAVNEQYYYIIEDLLIHNFDINHEDDQHRCAIDHAWINYKNTKEDDVKMKIEDVMLQLLSANSKLPNKKLNFSFDEAPEKVKEFIIKCEELHKCVANDKFEKLEFENNKLRYIYDKYNESLLLYALKLCKVDFIKKFGSFLSIRHDEVYYELTRDPRTEFNSKYPEIPKPHIIMLKSKSEIYGKKYQNHKNWIYIDNIYKLLDKNDICSKVLKIAAENKMLRIFFVPNEKEKDVEQYEKQTIFTRKHIYISANLTLEDEIKSTLDDATKTAKTLIDELCRVVASMLCLDNIEISKISTKDDRETNIQSLERTIRKVLSESQFDYFQKLNIEETIYILRILQAEDEVIKFEYLPKPMQEQILKPKVDFQGVDINFSDIIDGNRDVLTHLPSKLIRDILIRKMTIKIGDTLNMDSIYEIFDRNLVEYQPNTSDKELKTSILVDDFGTGKSTKFQHMSAKFKLELKSSWVCLIKLSNFSEILQKYSNQNIKIDEEPEVKLLLEIINPETKLEAELFKNLFLEKRVILLVDDIDEIEPKLAEFFMKVLGLIAAKLNKLWISTCPVFLTTLEKHLKGNLYKFYPYFSPFYQRILHRLLREFKNDDKIPDGLTSFISSLEDRKNGKHYTIMNCGMIRAIIETYVKDRSVFKEGTVNFYSIFEQIYTKQKNIFNKYIMDKPSNPFESFSISKVQQVYALKSIFSKHHDVQLEDLAIMKHWKREERKWTKEMIGRRGFISFVGNGFHFIHRSYAEFFVAEYLISYIFSYDYSIRDDEFEKIFNIIRFMTQKYDDFEIICKFIIGYAKSRVDSELHETMRDVIKDENNIQHIQEDINSSQNASELKEFWLEIVKSDKDLSEHIQLLTGH